MRALAVLAVAAAALVPAVAPAAEMDLPQDGCQRGQVWNGYRCEWARPRLSEAPPAYEAPPVYEAPPIYAAPPVYVAPPVYLAPPVYVARYYRPPVVRYYAGPRYVWGYGQRRYSSHSYGHYDRWRR